MECHPWIWYRGGKELISLDFTCFEFNEHYFSWCDVMWCDMICYDVMWYDMIRYDMIWNDMIWFDMIWYDTIWYDLTWYDMMCYIRCLRCDVMFCSCSCFCFCSCSFSYSSLFQILIPISSRSVLSLYGTIKIIISITVRDFFQQKKIIIRQCLEWT